MVTIIRSILGVLMGFFNNLKGEPMVREFVHEVLDSRVLLVNPSNKVVERLLRANYEEMVHTQRYSTWLERIGWTGDSAAVVFTKPERDRKGKIWVKPLWLSGRNSVTIGDKLVQISNVKLFDLERVSFGWATENGTIIEIVSFDEAGDLVPWDEFESRYGLVIDASKAKMAKRLSAVTNTYTVGGHTMSLGYEDEPGHRWVVTDRCYGAHESTDDGISIMSRRFAIACVRQTPNMTANAKRSLIYKIRMGKVNHAQMRILTDRGLLKSDVLLSADSDINGEDRNTAISTCFENNLKPELALVGQPFVGLTFHDHTWTIPATDAQTISWLGPWLYPASSVKRWMDSWADKSIELIRRGETPSIHVGESLEDEETDGTDAETTAQTIRNRRARWVSRFPGAKGVHFSRNMTFLDSHGLLSRLCKNGRNGGRELLPYGKQTPAHRERKMMAEIPNAIMGYVITRSTLEFAGYSLQGYNVVDGDAADGSEDTIVYHAETELIVVSDRYFEGHKERHGGWDQDDKAKAILVKSTDGVYRWVLVRSPNSLGEWGHAPAELDNNGELVLEHLPFDPNEVGIETVDFAMAPPFLEDVKATSNSVAFPVDNTKRPARLTAGYAQDLLDLGLMNPSVGRIMNALMAWYMTHCRVDAKGYHWEPIPVTMLGDLEDIVDTCQQAPFMDGLGAVVSMTNDLVDLLRSTEDLSEYAAATRVGKRDPETGVIGFWAMGEFYSLSVTRDTYIDNLLDEVYNPTVNKINLAQKNLQDKLCRTLPGVKALLEEMTGKPASVTMKAVKRYLNENGRVVKLTGSESKMFYRIFLKREFLSWNTGRQQRFLLALYLLEMSEPNNKWGQILHGGAVPVEFRIPMFGLSATIAQVNISLDDLLCNTLEQYGLAAAYYDARNDERLTFVNTLADPDRRVVARFDGEPPWDGIDIGDDGSPWDGEGMEPVPTDVDYEDLMSFYDVNPYDDPTYEIPEDLEIPDHIPGLSEAIELGI